MKISSPRRIIWGMIFLLLGVLWSGMIYARGSKAATKAVMAAQAANGQQLKKIRSPYVKDYHVVLFWFIVYLDVLCAASYVISGISLIRSYPSAKMAVMGSLSCDFIYKISILIYMHFCAIPIASFTRNPNVLTSLYTPDTTTTSKIYAHLSALKVYEPYGWIYGILYAAILIYGIYFFSRWEFHSQWRGVK